MTHNMKLNPLPFDMIKSGRKTIELRLYDEKRKSVKIGDIICFANTESGEEISAEVTALYVFPSFAELYKNLPLTECGYTAENVGDAKPEDMAEYYPAEKQKKYGVVGIGLKSI